MANNAQKIPISRSTPQFVQKQINRALQKLGGGLPGHVKSVGSNLVTISFDVSGLTIPTVRMPWAMAEYVRLPIQAGDKGVAIPGSKYYIGSASGIGTGIGGRTVQGNLSSLVWFPISNLNWSAVDANTLVLYGPTGVQVRDRASTAVLDVNTSGITGNIGSASLAMTSSQITLQVGSSSIVISSSGVSIMGADFLTHMHSGVSSGGSDTGPVVP